MHPRVSLHQVAFLDESSTAFAEHCRAIGVRNMTLVTPILTAPGGLGDARTALEAGGVRAPTLNHVAFEEITYEAYGPDGVALLVENAGPFNADIHIAHTLGDAIQLAERSGIGLCIELHACWFEAGLRDRFRAAMPLTGLVQVSDYVLGDRASPCRAVPGDGVIPLERLIGDVLEAGYQGLFDLELVGPRIAAEGARAATARAADYLSELLTRLGA